MKQGKRTRKGNISKIITFFVFATLIVSTVFLIVRLILSPLNERWNIPFARTKSDYMLMLLQCLLGLVAMLLPGFLSRKAKIEIPSNMYLLYVVFLYCAIYLGEVHSFFYAFSQWDTILHCFSGIMLGALGFSVITLLNKSENVTVNLSPFFVALFAFCFAIMLGVLWEIYEFTFDGLMGLNMQKFRLEDGTQLIGRAALADTMYDLIVDGSGALFMSTIGYISLKYKKGWIEKLTIKKKKSAKGSVPEDTVSEEQTNEGN